MSKNPESLLCWKEDFNKFEHKPLVTRKKKKKKKKIYKRPELKSSQRYELIELNKSFHRLVERD